MYNVSSPSGQMHDQKFSRQTGTAALNEASSKEIATEVQATGRVLPQSWRAENGFLVLGHVYFAEGRRN